AHRPAHQRRARARGRGGADVGADPRGRGGRASHPVVQLLRRVASLRSVVSRIAHGDMEQVAADAARLLPSSLVPIFDAGFTRSHVLFDEYVARLTAQVFRAAGLESAVAEWSAVGGVVVRA